MIFFELTPKMVTIIQYRHLGSNKRHESLIFLHVEQRRGCKPAPVVLWEGVHRFEIIALIMANKYLFNTKEKEG